ncbi:hypothetical protein QE152_g5503 [Popillia japonica]|uniref:Uncharacterized protein n=1 Tax=Popillia japonica TaxID=7064 RepID=A0AAW1MNF6_POPJA
MLGCVQFRSGAHQIRRLRTRCENVPRERAIVERDRDGKFSGRYQKLVRSPLGTRDGKFSGRYRALSCPTQKPGEAKNVGLQLCSSEAANEVDLYTFLVMKRILFTSGWVSIISACRRADIVGLHNFPIINSFFLISNREKPRMLAFNNVCSSEVAKEVDLYTFPGLK